MLDIAANQTTQIVISEPKDTNWKGSHWQAGRIEIHNSRDEKFIIPYSSDHFSSKEDLVPINIISGAPIDLIEENQRLRDKLNEMCEVLRGIL